MTSKEIRKKFLDFFISKNHNFIPSAPIIIKNDPTLMFTNSGMNQFKNIFLEYHKPKKLRITNIQKCLRISGKHNDLDDVGKDTYHHTMFEMLGNWSFGDYFKKETINWAWELLTKIYNIPEENIYVTIFKGDKKENILKDIESYYIWKELIDKNHILEGNKKNNFWEMAKIGPCGPCSEIHIDLRNIKEKKLIEGKKLINKNHPHVIEIWNLVFIEFIRKSDNSLKKLDKINIDTGMGLERLSMILQNKTSNYDTDLFIPLIKEVEKITNIKYYGKFTLSDISIRIIVDHIRAISFAIGDGLIPNNSGPGYVIRKILRRAISYGLCYLKVKEPFIFQLVDILKDQMQDFFPEIKHNSNLITEVIKEEEKSFIKNLKQGLNKLDNLIKNQNNNIIDGKLIYQLHDTYGFPSDLSQTILKERKYVIDEISYENEKKRIQEISKSILTTKIFEWKILKKNVETVFIGYDHNECEIEIIRYRKIENKNTIFYQLVFNQTPFYPESGGQIGDIGVIENTNEKINILDTKKEHNLIVHITKVIPKKFSNFIAKIDIKRRDIIQKNHSFTHLLHQTLREKIGDHIEQKGSYIGYEYLRFDFSHFSKLSTKQLENIENEIIKKISSHIPLCEYRNISKKEALKKGSIALFEEKYKNNVRMIQFGSSKELCKGTHVQNTAEIGFFIIISEKSISSGIRRIEAITSIFAINYIQNIKKQITNICKKTQHNNADKGVEKIIIQNKKLTQQINEYTNIIIKKQKSDWKKYIYCYNKINYLIVKTKLNQNFIKKIILQLKSEIENFYGIILSSYNKKAKIYVAISNNLINNQNLNAKKIIEILAKNIKGKGGGNVNFATAEGGNLKGLDEIFIKLNNQEFNL